VGLLRPLDLNQRHKKKLARWQGCHNFSISNNTYIYTVFYFLQIVLQVFHETNVMCYTFFDRYLQKKIWIQGMSALRTWFLGRPKI
jgi:hypothetical protein